MPKETDTQLVKKKTKTGVWFVSLRKKETKKDVDKKEQSSSN